MHAYRHSFCLVIIQMIWKAEQDAQGSHLMSPVPLCMSCQVLLSVLEEEWLSLRSNMVGPLVWISNEKPVGYIWTESSHLVLREPTALRGSFVYWSSEDEWRRLKLWALWPLGSFFHLLRCLLWCTIGWPNLFDNPVFVHKHSCEPTIFWEISGCCVCCWEIVALKTRHWLTPG